MAHQGPQGLVENRDLLENQVNRDLVGQQVHQALEEKLETLEGQAQQGQQAQQVTRGLLEAEVNQVNLVPRVAKVQQDLQDLQGPGVKLAHQDLRVRLVIEETQGRQAPQDLEVLLAKGGRVDQLDLQDQQVLQGHPVQLEKGDHPENLELLEIEEIQELQVQRDQQDQEAQLDQQVPLVKVEKQVHKAVQVRVFKS